LLFYIAVVSILCTIYSKSNINVCIGGNSFVKFEHVCGINETGNNDNKVNFNIGGRSEQKYLLLSTTMDLIHYLLRRYRWDYRHQMKTASFQLLN